MQQYFITGIGTDVGKTVVSAIISEALKASYWKPIQAGDLDCSDSIRILNLTENVNVLPEGITLSQPMSPHAAAKIDGIKIELSDFTLPDVKGNLIVEGAGGLMVPINEEGLMIVDLIVKFQLPVILVSRHYLGSINHSILSAESLQKRGIKIAGFVFVGEENKATEEIILKNTGLAMIARIPEVAEVSKDFILEQASLFRINN
ncbi:MAG TPA: dethiobiotin synthase [Crocinitomicaceae bacterium]|nr:dethiobiotin synthase [Crocinitomicaceae bacterium]